MQNLQIEYPGAAQDFGRDDVEGVLNAMLATAGELEKHGLAGIAFGEMAAEGHVHLHQEEVPGPFLFEVQFLVGPEALAADFGEDLVLFEFLPDVGEVIDFNDLADVEAAAARGGIELLQKVDDFALAGGWAGRQNNGVKNFAHVREPDVFG